MHRARLEQQNLTCTFLFRLLLEKKLECTAPNEEVYLCAVWEGLADVGRPC